MNVATPSLSFPGGISGIDIGRLCRVRERDSQDVLWRVEEIVVEKYIRGWGVMVWWSIFSAEIVYFWDFPF